MEAKNWRIGNLAIEDTTIYDYGITKKIREITAEDFRVSDERWDEHWEMIKGVPLTEEILLKCPNHKRVNGKNILNTIYFEIGRNRVISVGNIGTGNEAIWLCEIDPNVENRITDLVCIHNFDYDGKIMLHKFQNIFHLLTNEELTVNL